MLLNCQYTSTNQNFSPFMCKGEGAGVRASSETWQIPSWQEACFLLTIGFRTKKYAGTLSPNHRNDRCKQNCLGNRALSVIFGLSSQLSLKVLLSHPPTEFNKTHSNILKAKGHPDEGVSQYFLTFKPTRMPGLGFCMPLGTYSAF